MHIILFPYLLNWHCFPEQWVSLLIKMFHKTAINSQKYTLFEQTPSSSLTPKRLLGMLSVSFVYLLHKVTIASFAGHCQGSHCSHWECKLILGCPSALPKLISARRGQKNSLGMRLGSSLGSSPITTDDASCFNASHKHCWFLIAHVQQNCCSSRMLRQLSWLSTSHVLKIVRNKGRGSMHEMYSSKHSLPTFASK